MDSLFRLLHGEVSTMLSIMAQRQQQIIMQGDEYKDFDRIHNHLTSLQEDLEIMIAAYSATEKGERDG